MRRMLQIFLFFILLFLLYTSYAQKILLEYYMGRELVIYTPNYKLILLEELEQGDEIPEGSIIETGRKSSCELRLTPNGTIIKVGERTTFKIQQLQEPNREGKNEFKLISGAIRAVTSKKSGLEQYVFLSGSSTVIPEESDFGITVKTGWEEKLFVLAGEAKYVNAKGEELGLYANQMAGGLDDDFKVEPISVRMQRLANTLAFTHLNPMEINRYEESTSERAGTPTPGTTPLPTGEYGPVMTPEGTESPNILPTPGPIITAQPTSMYDDSEAGTLPGPTGTSEERDSEKSSSAFDPNRSELYPADVYEFAATYTYSYDFRIDEINDEYALISYTPPENEAEAGESTEEEEALSQEPEIPEYTLFEIYNVFEQKENLKGKDVYSGFVDSVYLEKVEDDVFYFSFLWEGAKKNIRPGFYLYPTGRLYSPDEDDVIVVPEEEEAAVTVEGEEGDDSELSDQSGTGSSTDKDGKDRNSNFSFDLGLCLNIGFFNFETGIGVLDNFLNLVAMLDSMHFRFFCDNTIKLTPRFGIGVELSPGIAFYEEYFYLDFPLRTYLRLGTWRTYIQPYCGYYFSLMMSSFSDIDSTGYGGLDFGVSVSLGGFYLEGGYVWGEIVGNVNYFKAGIGFVINDLFNRKERKKDKKRKKNKEKK